jgi:serine/threonine protein kinase
MDLQTWIQENNCLHKIRRYTCSTIYEVEIDQKKYLLKKIINQKEYHIGKELETLGLPTFPKGTQLLYSKISLEKLLKKSNKITENKVKETTKWYYYILSEEINGKTLLYLLGNLSKKELDFILQTIFFTLKCAWEKLKFVHLDLHLENIIIQTIDTPIFLEDGILCEHYLPVIIDFDRSITQAHPNPIYKNKTISNDMWKLLGILSIYLKDARGEMVLDYLERFMDRYEFQERKEEFMNMWFNVLPNEI